MIHRIAGLAAAAALAGLALGGPAAIAQPSSAPIWAQQASDLAADPAVTFGVLPNGLRYAVMRNATPPGQVSMRLLIRAGSMQEKPGQEGLAHFLEHLAFRGSTHLADGEVFPMLERLGLARGADSNAGTGAAQTVYQFDLPKADDATVDAGLLVLREIAGELLLTQTAMDGERGVILSEERLRDTPGLHATKVLNQMLLGDHPYARPTIGERSVIETAPVSRVRAFYEAYYRPERAVLVIVGDVDPAGLVGKITTRFGDWRGKGPAGTDPGPFTPANGEQARFYSEAGLAPQLVVAWTGAPQDLRDDKANEIERIQESLALSVLNKRYSDVTLGAKPPFVGAGAATAEIRHVARMTQLSAIAPTDWRPALTMLLATERQAVQFGVRQEELDRVVVQARTGLQAAMAAAPSRRTPALVGGLLGAAQSDQVYMSPTQRLALFEEAVRTLTVERADALIRSRFTGAGPTVFVATPNAADGDQASLDTVLAQAEARPVTALAQVEIKPWPYTDFGPPGQVVERRRIEDVGATLVRFANGVRLTIKPTDFTKSQILVRVRTGFGLLDLPSDRLTALSGYGTRIIDGGLADLSPIEVRRTLEGKVVSAGSGIGDQGFTFGGVTRPQDLDLEMQLLAAYHVKPGWRTDGLAERLQLAKTMYAQVESTPNGVFGRYAGLLLHSGDMRWKQPDPDELAAMRPQDVQTFMSGELASAPIEIVIVGDIGVEEAIAAAARTFGALPPREARAPDPAHARLKFPDPTSTPVVLRHKGRSDQALAFVAWPIPGYHDHKAALDLRLLQLIINDRLFDQVRTQEGKTYSPQGDLSTPLAFPSYGYLMESIETPQAQIPGVMAAIDRIVTDLAAKEVSLDELDRVRRPRIELWRRNLTVNDFWAGTLMGVWDDEDVLTPARTNVAAFATVTPAELKAAAKAYLAPERAFRLTVVPDALVTAAGTRP